MFPNHRPPQQVNILEIASNNMTKNKNSGKFNGLAKTICNLKKLLYLISLLALFLMITMYFAAKSISLSTFPTPSDETFIQAIYFVETNERCSPIARRLLCSIESALIHHPDEIVVLYSRCPNPQLLLSDGDDLMRNLQEHYHNFRIKYLDLKALFEGTPLKPLLDKEAWKRSPYRLSHLSDAVRIALMWKYGGIYLDLDVVVLKPLNSLHNAIGLETPNLLNGAVLVFDAFHPFISQSIVEYSQTYQPLSWPFNGPDLLTRVLKSQCKGNSNANEIKAGPYNCFNYTINVEPINYFYPIHWGYVEWLVNPNKTETVKSIIKNSYALHFWNKISKDKDIVQGSLLSNVFRAHCPTIYASI